MSLIQATCLVLFLFLMSQSHEVDTDSSFQKCNVDFRVFFSDPCLKKIRDDFDCIFSVMRISQNALDMRFRVSLNTTLYTKSLDYLCSHLKSPSIYASCKALPAYCKLHTADGSQHCGRNIDRCAYLQYEKCDVRTAMLKAGFLHQVTSQFCQDTDVNLGLLPSYGPQLKCYETDLLFADKNSSVLDNQIKFCKSFQYEKIKLCTDDIIKSTPEDQLLTDKSTFTTKAANFINKTRNLCEGLLKTPENTLSECRKKKFSNCEKRALAMAQMPDNLYRSGWYIDCISKMYSECHPQLGHLVKNLISTAPNLMSAFSRVTWTIASLCLLILL